jgi:hypothetical protein
MCVYATKQLRTILNAHIIQFREIYLNNRKKWENKTYY